MVKVQVWMGLLIAAVLIGGCRKGQEPEGEQGAAAKPAGKVVVVYTALDQQFSEPILKAFEEKTGIRADVKYDLEATKTVGLVNAIRAEKDVPRCDVFWNNEIVNTIRLKDEGLLAEYRPEAAKNYPATFKDPDGMWTGFAARARILLVNTDQVKPGDEPAGLEAMTDPKWKGRIGIAKPLFGTTASHAACLYALDGPEKMQDFFARLKANGVAIESGNKSVALAVSSGKLAFGLTDTDDAMESIADGSPVKIVYPDSGPDGRGTLFIPNTLALVRGAPHPEAAKALIEFLLSPEVETMLATGPSAQIPVNPAVTVETKVKSPREVKAMPVDFNAAAHDFGAAAKYIETTFLK